MTAHVPATRLVPRITTVRVSASDSECFETTVAGIPCICRVAYSHPATSWRQHTFAGAGPGDCDPPQPSEFDYEIYDRKGYRAHWLEEKLTREDDDRLEDEMKKGL